MHTQVNELSKQLSEEQIAQCIEDYFKSHDVSNKKILLIIPDHTRSGPVGSFFKAIFNSTCKDVSSLDILVALGTHPMMSEEQICQRLDITLEERQSIYNSVQFFNHEWHKTETFKTIGTINADEIEQISQGKMNRDVDVTVNKRIFDYDELIILGPVFPHEVVGFSGGHKYIFPGIAGQEIINLFHWMGALFTNPVINGTQLTPPREIVEKAASFIDLPRQLIAMVTIKDNLKGIFCGDVFDTWKKAAELSSKVHIIQKEKQYKTVLGIAPQMYDDLWTAGKVMYKLEPIVKDGGTLIIYAPHVSEISVIHGKHLEKCGYHTRDFFLDDWENYKDIPGGVLAHSTHVKGIGKMEDGVEKPRINVVLATKIPESTCKKVNLGYMDLKTINLDDYRNKEDEDILLVEHAGELLHHPTS